jgi:hypothetical protein
MESSRLVLIALTRGLVACGRKQGYDNVAYRLCGH